MRPPAHRGLCLRPGGKTENKVRSIEHGAGGKERNKEAGKQGGWEAKSYISSRLKGGSSTVGGVRLEVGGRKGIISIFPQSTNQRINQSTTTGEINER